MIRKNLSKAPCQTTIAFPMVIHGICQGATLGQLPASGIADGTSDDAEAGVVNDADQSGGTLRPGSFVTVFTATGSQAPDVQHLLSERVSGSISAGTFINPGGLP
jgi:hypothetical protein